ncbi:MAG: PBP1A family penicillin-binding protein [Thermodesulfovibrionia bacterium]
MKGAIIKILATTLILILGVAIGGYLAILKSLPDIEDLRDYMPTKGTEVYADDDTLIGNFRIEKGIYVPLNKVPEHLIKAVVAVEDSNFWVHSGLDYLAIIRALSKDILAGRLKEGASTITQQLAKVVFLSPEKTLIRKLKEVVLAFKIEKTLTKEEILELYLNKVYFGHGAYGVEMAARAYFGKSVSDIDLSEAALLAGLIKAPNRFSPYNSLEIAKDRQMTVLKRMEEEGYINRQQIESAYKKPLYLSSMRYSVDEMNYFLEYIRKYLEDKYGLEMVYKGGLKVYTTINRNIQRTAVESLREGLRELDKRQGFRGPIGHRDVDVKKEAESPAGFKRAVMKSGDIITATVLNVSPSSATVKTRGVIGTLPISEALWANRLVNNRGEVIRRFNNLKLTDILKEGDIIYVRVKDVSGKTPIFSLEQEPIVQGALVAIEHSTGYIRALVGGYDFRKSEFNRAVYSKRQAGSAFKPMIYATAMDNGFTPASVIIDEPISYKANEFSRWSPDNYDRKYYGPTRLRDALAYSRNVVTVKLLDEIGVEKVIKFARSIGINGPFPHNLTLALGSISVTPLELTSAYSVFANGGIRIQPIAIKYIADSNGNIIESNKPNGERVISPQTAFLTTTMLEEVVNRGTGQRAKEVGRTVAGKTGTTNDYKDAWFIGYSPKLTAGVWVGFDDMRSLGEGEVGARAALPIWVYFMKRALVEVSSFDDSMDKMDFPVPEGIVTAVIDPSTGLLATENSEKMVEFFKEGTVPRKYSTGQERQRTDRIRSELGRIKP